MSPISPELILAVHEVRAPDSRGQVNLAFCSEVLCPIPRGDCVVRLDAVTSVVPDSSQNDRIAAYLKAHFIQVGFFWFNPAMVIRAQILPGVPMIAVISTAHCRRRTVDWDASKHQVKGLIRKAGLVETGHEGEFVSLDHTLFYDTARYRGFIREAGGTTAFSVFDPHHASLSEMTRALDWIPVKQSLQVNPAHCKMISKGRVYLTDEEGFLLDDVAPAGLDRLVEIPWMSAGTDLQVNLLAVNLHVPATEVSSYPKAMGLFLGARDLCIWLPEDEATAIVEAAMRAQGFLEGGQSPG